MMFNALTTGEACAVGKFVHWIAATVSVADQSHHQWRLQCLRKGAVMVMTQILNQAPPRWGGGIDLCTGQIIRCLPRLDRAQFQRRSRLEMAVADSGHYLLAAREHNESEGGLLV